MNITGPSDMTMEEIDEASNYIKEEVNTDAEIFWGVVFDDNADNEIKVTVIATGIGGNGDGLKVVRKDLHQDIQQDPNDETYGRKVVNIERLRDLTDDEAGEAWTVKRDGEIIDDLDIPTFQRNKPGSQLSPYKEEPSRKKKGLFGKYLGFKESLDYPTFLRLKAD